MAKQRTASKTKQTFRFAHPFFTQVPIAERKTIRGFGARMLDHVEKNLQKVPSPKGDSVMTLADIVGSSGASAIEATGTIRFHAVGDTGRRADSPQGDVARAMTGDFDVARPENSPAFFFHLGDVIYGPNKIQEFRREYYEPYAHYPGKIIAIPGNHDGEVFPKTDPQSLQAFKDNFCARTPKVPAIAGTIFRETMNQPGVYWRLNTPLVDVVGLYSNAAENPGFISGGAAGTKQRQWLTKTLSTIAKARKKGPRKALVLATHHPPYTAGGHSPSHEMLNDIDDACTKANIMPDLVLSAHSHNYQRYSRTVQALGASLEVPYVVAGCGGVNDSSVPAADGVAHNDKTSKLPSQISFLKSRKGYGYLLLEITSTSIVVKCFAVDGDTKSLFEEMTFALR